MAAATMPATAIQEETKIREAEHEKTAKGMLRKSTQAKKEHMQANRSEC